MKFKFILARHKIHPKVNKYHTQWYLLIDTEEALLEFCNSRNSQIVRSYFNLKSKVSETDCFRYKNGNHICNEDELMIANRLALDETRETILDDSKILDSFVHGYVNTFFKIGHIIVSPNNSYRFMDETFKILDTKEVEGIVFPATSEKDIKVLQWNNGRHWYVRVGNYDLPMKYNSYEEGLNAGKELLKNGG